MFDTFLFTQILLSGLVIGVIYALMAVGITFIYSIMKMINWSMGEYYMIGSYLQYLLVIHVLGFDYWYVGIPLAAGVTFVLGMVIQRVLLKPMYVGEAGRRDEYAAIMTVTMMVLYRNLAVVVAGPNVYATKDYAGPVVLGTLPMSGNRLVAMLGTLVILVGLYGVIKKTWIGLAFRGTAQNRVGIQTAGINVRRVDEIAFGIGVAMAAAAGALLAPVFLIYPENGVITTLKGFEIIVIGGLGSIPGSLVAALLLGVVEKLGSVYVSSSYEHLYGFLLLMALLAVRPTGLFGERERTA
jgi:branched-chain amino acid transport system permease protein